MIDPLLLDFIKEDTPKFTREVVEGVAFHQMKDSVGYLRTVAKSGFKSFPPCLEFVNIQVCTPEQEFAIETRVRSGKRIVDVAKSEIVMVRFNFRLTEQDGRVVNIERYQYVPNVREGGLTTISGTEYSISPVLADRIISPGLFSVFVRLLRGKITFEKLPYWVMIDGRMETSPVIWAPIYHKSAKQKKIKATTKAKSCVGHYLFCKYGFTKTMQLYTGVTPVVGNSNNINAVDYPAEDWVIYGSTGLKPDTAPKSFYERTNICLAVPRDKNTQLVKSLITSFYYVVDHFPNRFDPSYVDSERLWCVLLGHILWSGTIVETKLCEDVGIHLRSLDEYIDSLIEKGLKDLGYNCNSIYTLFALVLENFSKWIIDAKDTVTSMYDKELSVLYYIFESINNAIFKLVFAMRSGGKKHFTEREVVSIMNRVFKKGLIYQITKQKPYFTPVGYCGDNMVFRITDTVVPQQQASSFGNNRLPSSDPSRRFDASIVDVGQHIALPKAEPTGRARLSPYLTIGKNWTTARNPQTQERLEAIQKLIARR